MYCITSRKDVINMEYKQYSKYEIGELMMRLMYEGPVHLNEVYKTGTQR